MVKICTVCGTKSPDEYRFCMRCNGPLPDTPPPIISPPTSPPVASKQYYPPVVNPDVAYSQSFKANMPVDNNPPTVFPYGMNDVSAPQKGKATEPGTNNIFMISGKVDVDILSFFIFIIGIVVMIGAAALFIGSSVSTFLAVLGGLIVVISFLFLLFFNNKLSENVKEGIVIATGVIIAFALFAMATLR